MYLVGQLAESDAHVREVTLSDVFSGSEDYGFLPTSLAGGGDPFGMFFVQHGVVARQVFHTGLVEQIVVVGRIGVEEAVGVLGFERAWGG